MTPEIPYDPHLNENPPNRITFTLAVTDAQKAIINMIPYGTKQKFYQLVIGEALEVMKENPEDFLTAFMSRLIETKSGKDKSLCPNSDKAEQGEK